MPIEKIVFDTNCLLASLSSRSENFLVWQEFQAGGFILCVSNEILEEYQEVIARLASADVAKNVINAIVESEFVQFIDPQFHLDLITADKDDNKFVDCAFAANAAFIVSNDSHFDVLRAISFPRLLVIRLNTFLEMLRNKSTA